jgi:hypothetical protein
MMIRKTMFFLAMLALMALALPVCADSGGALADAQQAGAPQMETAPEAEIPAEEGDADAPEEKSAGEAKKDAEAQPDREGPGDAALESDEADEADEADELDELDETGETGELQKRDEAGDQAEADAGSLTIYAGGQQISEEVIALTWNDLVDAPPAVALMAEGAQDAMFSSSDVTVAVVDASGLVTGVGYGAATITVTTGDAHASLNIEVVRPIDRLVIIGEDSISPGRSIKLRAFDQDGNRVRAVWRSSSDALAAIDSEGVLTAGRRASGHAVEITAYAWEGAPVYAIKTVQIS